MAVSENDVEVEMNRGCGKIIDEAAVLLVLAGQGEDERILLTQRAAHLTLHSGEVAFPGGKWEEVDEDLCCTALREAAEEVGLDVSLVDLVGELPASFTRSGIRVTPYVCRAPENIELTANPGELESLFWVPTAFLLDDQRVRTDIFATAEVEHWAPVYEYLGYTIWGFTARVLVDYLNQFWGANIRREHRAPSARYKQR